jgi:hypothetical protein
VPIRGSTAELQTPMTHFYANGGEIRLPVDLMFFPSSVERARSCSQSDGEKNLQFSISSRKRSPEPKGSKGSKGSSSSSSIKLSYDPSVKSLIKVEPQAKAEENFLKTLLGRNETDFNNLFADVYSKMLEIGVNPQEMGPWYEDRPDPHMEDPQSFCPQGWYYAKIGNIP